MEEGTQEASGKLRQAAGGRRPSTMPATPAMVSRIPRTVLSVLRNTVISPTGKVSRAEEMNSSYSASS
jgi:hypothetical protein